MSCFFIVKISKYEVKTKTSYMFKLKSFQIISRQRPPLQLLKKNLVYLKLRATKVFTLAETNSDAGGRNGDKNPFFGKLLSDC